MNKKIFYFLLACIIVGIGIQSYSKYSSLKSIDSYDSCATSPDSRIEESDPATCITRLGTRFVEQIPLPIPNLLSPQPLPSPNKQSEIWKVYQSSDYSFKYPPDWEIVPFDALGIFAPSSSSSINDNYKITIQEVNTVPTVSIVTIRVGTNDFIKISNSRDSANYTFYDEYYSNHKGKIWLIKLPSLNNENIFKVKDNFSLANQILSTFKFTD